MFRSGIRKILTEPEENDIKKKIDKLLIDYKRLQTDEIDNLIECIVENNYMHSEINKLVEEKTKRATIRENAVRQPIINKASWGFPVPVLKHKIDTRLSSDQFKYLVFYVQRIMFWKFDISIEWLFNKSSITLIRDINPKPIKPQQISSYNPVIIAMQDKFGNVLIKCKSNGDIIYDSDDNHRSLQLFLSAFIDIAKSEQIMM